MVNARIQIKEALETICERVNLVFPEKNAVLPLIVYAEITNTTVGMWEESVEYQIDVYASSFAELVDLAENVDVAMTELGFERTYVTPDTDARIETNLYKKALNYHAYVDTYHNNIVTEGY